MDVLNNLCQKYNRNIETAKSLFQQFNYIESNYLHGLPFVDENMISLYAHACFCIYYNFDIKVFASENHLKKTIFTKAYREIKKKLPKNDSKIIEYDLHVGLFSIKTPNRFNRGNNQ